MNRRRWTVTLGLMVVMLALSFRAGVLGSADAAARFGSTALVSSRFDGRSNDGDALNPAVSRDGRFIAFVSNATDLASRDGNLCASEPDYLEPPSQIPCWDVYVKDRATGRVLQVSVSSGGELANGNSSYPGSSSWPYYEIPSSPRAVDPVRGPDISSTGRVVAFASDATNLVPGDTNGATDVFVHDLTSGRTERVSISSSGIQAHGWSNSPSISADGRFVAFTSTAADLVPGDLNAEADVFVHDRRTGATRLVSRSSTGAQSDGYSGTPSLSPDGRYVAFASLARSLAPGFKGSCQFGDDERFDCSNIYLRDMRAGTTAQVAQARRGTFAMFGSTSPDVSRGARRVTFTTDFLIDPAASGGSDDVYVHDVARNTTIWASRRPPGVDSGGGREMLPSISDDGRYVAFPYWANLINGEGCPCPDVYVFDVRTGRLTRESVTSDGLELDGFSPGGAISPDGSTIAFWTFGKATRDDTDTAPDVYAHRLASSASLGTRSG